VLIIAHNIHTSWFCANFLFGVLTPSKLCVKVAHMKRRKRRINVSLTEETISKLEILSKDQFRSISSHIDYLVEMECRKLGIKIQTEAEA
jgi:hypothetical protein